MSDICKKYFMRDLYRKIDGAVITSQNERELDCSITFQTHSILQRFMLRFDQLQLDCNDHLYIYDGAHAVGSYKCLPRNFASSRKLCSSLVEVLEGDDDGGTKRVTVKCCSVKLTEFMLVAVVLAVASTGYVVRYSKVPQHGIFKSVK
ncbi:hypothetical protein X777_01323 [Ooceraea biroi]|nr:hypothetical protein X777_01323 [Ooceraea biroi]